MEDAIDKIYEASTEAADSLCRFLEWYTHSDDIKQYSTPQERPNWVPVFNDDDGDYCDDYDVFFDEYDWESSNDLA